jgi:hypothetical protein
MGDIRKESGKPQSIRFPPSLANTIRERARAADRTFSGEVIHVLRTHLSGSAAAINQDEVERLATICRQMIGGDES